MNRLIIFFVSIFSFASLQAQVEMELKLYEGEIPNSKPIPQGYEEYIEVSTSTGRRLTAKVTTPTLKVFLPDKSIANGTAVIICPGGGYRILTMNEEGADVAKLLNKQGIAAFVLKSRLPSDLIMQDKSIGSLQDAQRAIQLVRKKASEWNIDINKVGIMGFSAGGHLASTALTHFNKNCISNNENINLRPDFGVLIYPVISMGEFTHQGSKTNLLGANPSDSLVKLFSNELQVNKTTPTTFLVHATDDKTVPVQNSLLFYQALIKNEVKAEMHIYQNGGHGYGLVNKTTKDAWLDRCINWMEANKWLKK